jgi:hypothetical protein
VHQTNVAANVFLFSNHTQWFTPADRPNNIVSEVEGPLAQIDFIALFSETIKLLPQAVKDALYFVLRSHDAGHAVEMRDPFPHECVRLWILFPEKLFLVGGLGAKQ